MRKYHVRIESVLYDSSVYQFVDDEDMTLMTDNDERLNVNACAVVYESDAEFGELYPIPTSLTNPNCHDLPSSKINPNAIQHLTKAQQTELLKLLDCFPQCFSDVPGFSDVLSHTITLKEGFKPKQMSAYRVPEKLKAAVDKQIQEMLDQKIIRPSLSPMASPLVCILKGKDGRDGIRLAVDYRLSLIHI